MTAMLADQDRDRRQLRDLTPPGPPGRHPLLSGEVITAAPAAFRIVVDELVDQILALERTTRALMPGLAAGRSRSASRANSSFAFARASARRC